MCKDGQESNGVGRKIDKLDLEVLEEIWCKFEKRKPDSAKEVVEKNYRFSFALLRLARSRVGMEHMVGWD
jgi:hypothetical protein